MRSRCYILAGHAPTVLLAYCSQRCSGKKKKNSSGRHCSFKLTEAPHQSRVAERKQEVLKAHVSVRARLMRTTKVLQNYILSPFQMVYIVWSKADGARALRPNPSPFVG